MHNLAHNQKDKAGADVITAEICKTLVTVEFCNISLAAELCHLNRHNVISPFGYSFPFAKSPGAKVDDHPHKTFLPNAKITYRSYPDIIQITDS